jgi:hypothetical protein
MENDKKLVLNHLKNCVYRRRNGSNNKKRKN